MSYFRKNIDNMEGYVPGEQPKGGNVVKLNTNENPYPPSPAVIEALQKEINGDLRLYPDPIAGSAKNEIGKLFNISPNSVIVGNGSDDVLTMIIRSFVGPGDKVVIPYPTYSLYETLAELQDGEICNIDFNDDFSLSDNIVVKDARVTFLSNPNSPSGTMIPPEKVLDIAKKIEGVLVVDEAYADFAETNCVGLIDKCPNVIVLRTLSKSYSLAGLRLGIGMAQEELINGMTKVKDSYNVDRLGIVGLVAALKDQDHMQDNAEKIKKTRVFLSESLTNWGFHVHPSQSNFIFAKCPGNVNANELFSELKNRQILVRYFNKPKTDDCLRITIGTDDEIKTLLTNIADILKIS